jgi:hypothetical protein
VRYDLGAFGGFGWVDGAHVFTGKPMAAAVEVPTIVGVLRNPPCRHVPGCGEWDPDPPKIQDGDVIVEQLLLGDPEEPCKPSQVSRHERARVMLAGADAVFARAFCAFLLHGPSIPLNFKLRNL